MNTHDIIFNGDCCAYLRKSRADADAELRGEGETLARHKRILEELSAKLKVPIKKFYCEVVSGDTIEDRPVIQQVLREVESGMWSGVFAVEVERLARGNTKDQGIVADCFKYSGTKIITPVKIYDPNNEFDEEYFEFGLFMARREYKTINRRLQRGRISSVNEGKYICSTAPYGYSRVKIPDQKGYTLELVPHEADTVRMIFDWYCNGVQIEDGSCYRLGPDKIAKKLDSLGIRPRVSNVWSRATIRDMLKNPTYCGDVRFGYRMYKKQSNGGHLTKTRKVNENHVYNTGMHPAIISREQFETAQRIRTKHVIDSTAHSSVLQNPLSGLVYCKKCGALMTRLGPNSHANYATLKCPNRYCDTVSSPLFLVEDQVINFLSEWVDNYNVNSELLDKFSAINSEIDVLQKSINNNNLELKKLHSQLDKAYSLLEQEVYTLEVFQERRKTISADINSLELAVQKYGEELAKYMELKYSAESFYPRVNHLLETYSSISPAVKNNLLKELIEKIEYQKDSPNSRGKLLNANFVLEIYPKIPD